MGFIWSALQPQVAPLGVPQEEALLERGEVEIGWLGDAFEGKQLSSGQDIVKAPNHRKGRLSMVPDGNLVAVGELKVRFVPLKDIFATLVFPKKNLRAKEPDFQSWEMVSFTLKSGDPTSIVEYLIPKAPLLMSNQPSSNAIKREWRRKINERPRNKVGETGTDAFGVS
jgi:hypothetical protein